MPMPNEIFKRCLRQAQTDNRLTHQNTVRILKTVNHKPKTFFYSNWMAK
jgi:hypothetical protein